MAGGFNITTQGLMSSQRIDPASQRLQQMASIPNSFNPTSSRILAISEQDKQTDDNATFIFEYRALLSSRLQQLITKLTNAFTSDLDGALGAGTSWGKPRTAGGGTEATAQGRSNDVTASPWGAKNAMQGAANNGSEDPGAARVTFAYLSRWGTTTHNFSDPDGGGPGTPNTAAYGTNGTSSLLSASGAFSTSAQSQFQVYYDSDGDGIRDTLGETVTLAPQSFDNSYQLMSNTQVSNGSTSLQSGGGGAALLGAYAIRFNPGTFTLGGNVVQKEKVVGLGWHPDDDGATEFQRALAKSFQKREFQDILKWGFLGKEGDAIYIASTTSTASGSQIQSTLKLEYIGDNGGGYITVKQDRWTAFYHS